MTSLYDGLGGEEIAQSGLQAGATNISPYFTGSITSADAVKGANVIGTTAISGVTLAGTSVYGSTIVSGALVLGTNAKATTLSGANLNITTGSCTAIVNASGKLNSVRQGASYGGLVQAGSGTLGGGSCWLSFPVAFTSIPQVVIAGYADAGAPSHITQVPYVFAGSTSVGSCYVTGSSANTFNWVAVGL